MSRAAAAPTAGLSAAAIAGLRAAVLAWYDRQRRDLPWRRDPTLYGTWVAETMLQQTTVAAVVPYWHRFLARFPDVAALAAADREDVLAAWAGLGYYGRAHRLHDAAREVMANRAGRLPDDLEGWRGLPGVGPYAAGAIASIGLGLAVPAVDANARRVITRWLARTTAHEAAPARVAAAAAACVDPTRPGDWNQAVMELGATVCRAARVACAACPARPACGAARLDHPARVASPRPAPAVVPVVTSVLVAVRAGRTLLLPASCAVVARAGGLGAPVREDFTDLQAGLLGLPQLPWYRPPSTPAVDGFAGAWRHWLAAVAPAADDLRPCGRLRHRITRHALDVAAYRVEIAPGDDLAAFEAELAGRARWATFPEGSGAHRPLPLGAIARRAMELANRRVK